MNMNRHLHTLAFIIGIAIGGSAWVFAAEPPVAPPQAQAATPPAATKPATEAATAHVHDHGDANDDDSQDSSGHSGHGDKGGGKQGGGKHGGGMHGGMEEKHRQMVNRIDMIEARLAKIELMLERLMQR